MDTKKQQLLIMAGKRVFPIFLLVLLWISLPVYGVSAQSPDDYGDIASTPKTGLAGTWNRRVEEQEETEEPVPDGSKYNTVRQLTEEDILLMNHYDATLLYSDEGYLTFLRGKYYEEKVSNEEEGILSLNGMASLLGLSKGSEFFAVFSETNKSGYTIYIYQQRYGDLTIENAVLKIIVGPDGYTAGLVNSFAPNVGIAPEDESAITAAEAEESVSQVWSEDDLHFYPEYTRQTSVTIANVAYHAWAIFTDIPASVSEEAAGSERPYLEHLVAYDGSYLMYMSVGNPRELVLGDNAQTELALSWFEGMQPDTWTGTVTRHDGSTKELSVPVVRDTEGNYYLADLQRHILLSDYHTFAFSHEYQPWTSPDNTGWPDRYLLTYDTMIRVYDFFDRHGMTSVDGFGAPILLLTDYCDQMGNPEDNACFLGFTTGWALFAFSSLNDFGESVDVVAHEFTHGITTYTLAGDVYANESGALNEALSDIMGNLCEILMGETAEGNWELAESSGRTLRDMAFPWLYAQPVSVGGKYYVETVEEPSVWNDYGGVHTNSSIISHIAWELCSLGLDPEDSFRLWLDAINFLSPYSGYKGMHYALEFAWEMRGMDIEWLGKLHMAFEQAGIE